jgi:transcriptional regulator with XRE-family HTH domain
MSKGFTYKSYSFQDKDPIIDEVRTIVQMSGATYKRIEEDSGVTFATLRAWFQGKTRKPQAATLNAVARALGFKLGFVPSDAAWGVKPTPAEPAKASMSHVVRMRRAK